MSELVRRIPADQNYTFEILDRYHSRVKLFAPHGGCIEPGTGPLIAAIAGDRFDYFIFRGIRKKDCFRTLHVSSLCYDEPRCLQMAREALVSVAIHGCDGNKSAIEIGGGNTELAIVLVEYLQSHGYPATEAPEDRGGKDARNFINCAKQKGVQLELSVGFRRTLFPDFPKTGNRNRIVFDPFVRSVRVWLEQIESEMGLVQSVI